MNLMKLHIIALSTLLVCHCTDQSKRTEQQTSSTTEQQQDTKNSIAIYTAAFIKGNVSWSADDNQWNRLDMQMSVSQGNYVETGKKSGATLQGSIGDIVQMGEQAKVQLSTEELQKQGERISLAMRAVRLFHGKAKFSVEKGKGTFTVETPSVRVQVKGTTFTVNVDSTGNTDVAVIEGAVNVISLKDTSNVKELKPGYVLRGSGDNPTIETLITNDTIIPFEETIDNDSIQNSEKNSTEKNIIDKAAAIDTAAIKKRLTPTSGYHSKATEQAGIIAAQKIDQERQTVEQKMENEKSDFSDKKDAIETEHAAMKEAAEKAPDQAREKTEEKLDNERGTSDAAMDRAREEVLKKMQKERATTKSEPTMTGGSKASDDAFDELRRRRGE
jgi:hypothetical protein